MSAPGRTKKVPACSVVEHVSDKGVFCISY